ncbi:hypothetical protein OC845_006853, partial [Tilletia horrida]
DTQCSRGKRRISSPLPHLVDELGTLCPNKPRGGCLTRIHNALRQPLLTKVAFPSARRSKNEYYKKPTPLSRTPQSRSTPSRIPLYPRKLARSSPGSPTDWTTSLPIRPRSAGPSRHSSPPSDPSTRVSPSFPARSIDSLLEHPRLRLPPGRQSSNHTHRPSPGEARRLSLALARPRQDTRPRNVAGRSFEPLRIPIDRVRTNPTQPTPKDVRATTRTGTDHRRSDPQLPRHETWPHGLARLPTKR